jgi:hypothetical protein
VMRPGILLSRTKRLNALCLDTAICDSSPDDVNSTLCNFRAESGLSSGAGAASSQIIERWPGETGSFSAAADNSRQAPDMIRSGKQDRLVKAL